MKPAFFEIPSFVRGDTWNGINSISITVNSSFPIASVVSSRIQFKTHKKDTTALATLTSADGSIVITDVDAWTFHIPQQNIDLPVGKLFWDMEIVDSSDNVRTYLEGTVTVLQDVTR
jgi:hypothetical protein